MVATVAAIAVLASRVVFGQEDCVQLVEQARRAYAEGNLARVLALTNGCVADRTSRQEALGLRARTFDAQDQVEEAERAMTALLTIDPQFLPASDDTGRFRGLVARVRRSLIGNVTNSVSKMNESLLEAPATVVVVTADQIRRRGYLDLEAVLHDLPGFDISRTNGQNYANIYQRGYRSDATNRTLFIVDGVEQNDLYSNIAYISRQYPLSSIDRIEVVYGPASTMYGANAFLGVVNVITREPEAFLDETGAQGGEIHVGGGAFNTKYFDATIAGRFRDATFSVTGRVFRSDEWDLSNYSDWIYDPGLFSSPDSVARYSLGLRGIDTTARNFRFYGPTAVDIAKSSRLDASLFGERLRGAPLGYSDLADDWIVGSRLKVSSFVVGFDSWRRREGAASSATFRREPGALNGNVWSPHQTTVFAKYGTALSGSLQLTYFGQAKLHRLGRGSASYSLSSYLYGPLNLFRDLDNDVRPFWAITELQESSTQFRNELTLVQRFSDALTVVGGIDLRNGLIQADYSRATNCIPPLPLLFADPSGEKYRHDQVRDLIDRIFQPSAIGDLYFPFVLRTASLLYDDVRSQPTCSLIGAIPPPITSGGEHYVVRDTGVFGQASYRLTAAVKFVGAVRVDNDRVDAAAGFPAGGFGTVLTPRLAAIVSARRFVFKAIYSEAFKDPSSFEKFSTLPGIRDVQNPELTPERAKSFELSVGRQGPRLSADIALNRSSYSDLITLRNRDVANYGSICRQRSSAFCDEGLVYNAAVSTLEWLSTPGGSTAEAAAKEKMVELFAQLSPKAFDYYFHAPLISGLYTNTGAMTVWSVQASATGQFRGVQLSGNYTYSRPYNVAPIDEFGEPVTLSTADGSSGNVVTRLRVADIASHHLNIGAEFTRGRFDGSIRANIVGSRPTGAGTTVPESPLTSIDGYGIANGSIGYRVTPTITGQVIVNNLFNSQYSDPGVGTADGIRFASSVPQPGRSWYVRLLTGF